MTTISQEDKTIEYVTANGVAQESGCSLFLRKKIADNPAVLAKLSTETGGGEPPTPSVVYLNLERTEYELCALVRLLIQGGYAWLKVEEKKTKNDSKNVDLWLNLAYNLDMITYTVDGGIAL